MNSSQMADCQYHIGLIRSFLTMFSKSNPDSQPIIWLKILYMQVQYILMALDLGRVGTFSFLE